MLVDGTGGPPVHDSVVLIQGEKIAAVGPRGTVQIPDNAKVISAGNMTVMPGLFDLHVHLILMGHGKYYEYLAKFRNQVGKVMPISARELLMHGVTSARDVGAPLEEILELRDRLNRGEIPGPRLFVSGPVLQKTVTPEEAFFHWRVANPEDARAKTRKLLEAGVDLIKVIQATEMSDAELAAIIEEAHKAGKPVAAHGFVSLKEIEKVVQAGADSIEHTGLTPGVLPYPESILRLLAEKNVYVVPTSIVMWVYKLTGEFPERRFNPEVEQDYPADVVQAMEESLTNFTGLAYFQIRGNMAIRQIPLRLRQLIECGVRVVTGTDSGTPLNFHTDTTWREIQLFVQNGMTPLEAISAATKLPALLMKQGDKQGTLEPGKLADMVM